MVPGAACTSLTLETLLCYQWFSFGRVRLRGTIYLQHAYVWHHQTWQYSRTPAEVIHAESETSYIICLTSEVTGSHYDAADEY